MGLLDIFKSQIRMTGTVKWFNSEKGFGFITETKSGGEYFVHFMEIIPSVPNSYRSLDEGQAVQFEGSSGQKGLQAVRVKVIN